MTSSKKIYDSSDHNVWFYFNVGGTQAEQAEKGSTDAGAFATEMNKWLLDVINLKTNGGTAANGNLVYSDPSSLGIVMFNQCTNGTYKGPDIVNAIIMMNNKFELKIKSPNAKSAYQGASLDNGGNAVTPN